MDTLGRPVQRNRLVLSIIEEHFGPVVKDVAQLLLTRQRCTFFDLKSQLCKPPSTAPTGRLVPTTQTKLLPSEVRRSLLVLLHHNCLVTYLPTEEEMLAARKVELCYRIDTATVLSRIRYPKYLAMVKRQFGDMGVALTEELMYRGRQTAPALVSAAALKVAKDEAHAQGMESGPSPDRIEALEREASSVLERLIHGRYFVSVAPIDVDSLKASREKVAAEIAATMRPGRAKAAGTAGGAAGGTAAAATAPSAAEAASNGSAARQKRKNENGTGPKSKRKAPSTPSQDDMPIELRMMMKNEQEIATLARQHGVQFATDLPAVQPPPSATTERPGRTETTERPARGRGRGRGRRTTPGARVPSPTDDFQSEVSDESKAPAASDVSAVAAAAATLTALGPRENVLWKIGDEQFVRECRRQKCINFAGEKMNRHAAEVVSAMLALSAPAETSPKPDLSEPASLQQICEKSKLDMVTVRRLIDLMKTDALHMVMKSSADSEWSEKATYVVNMGNIIEDLKARAIHSIAEIRYGTYAARICELLARKKYLDQQKVGEMAILPAKTAREQLYLLQREGWITNIDISKRSDFNVGSTFWFWTLDEANLERIVLEHLYQAAYNLRARRQHEFLQGKDLVEFAQAGEQETERLQRLSTILARLDKALLEVDETIMLFARY